MMMKPGQIAQFAIWLNGEETEEQLKDFMEVQTKKIIEETERQNNNSIVLKNLRHAIKRPGEEGVPRVPSHIKGIDVRLLVFECDVFEGDKKIERHASITHDLDSKSLQTLRRITRREHCAAHPGMPALSNKQCDSIINAMGTEIIARMLNASVH